MPLPAPSPATAYARGNPQFVGGHLIGQTPLGALLDHRADLDVIQRWITLTNNSGTPDVSAATLLVGSAEGGDRRYAPLPA